MNKKEIQRLIVDSVILHKRLVCPSSYIMRDTMSCSGGIERINPCENISENGICIYCSRVASTVA